MFQNPKSDRPFELQLVEAYIVRRLIAAKGDIDSIFFEGVTRLMIAVAHNQLESAKLLLDAGADPNFACHESGMTPFRIAAINGNVEVAKSLLDAGADPNYIYENGFTPLIVAIQNNNLDFVKLLLDAGADPYAHRSSGLPLVIAEQYNCGRGIKELLQAVEDIIAAETLLKYSESSDLAIEKYFDLAGRLNSAFKVVNSYALSNLTARAIDCGSATCSSELVFTLIYQGEEALYSACAKSIVNSIEDDASVVVSGESGFSEG